MRLLHAASRTSARFDDPNLVSRAGLVPAVRLMTCAGLAGLVDECVRVEAGASANAPAKIGSPSRISPVDPG